MKPTIEEIFAVTNDVVGTVASGCSRESLLDKGKILLGAIHGYPPEDLMVSYQRPNEPPGDAWPVYHKIKVQNSGSLSQFICVI